MKKIFLIFIAVTAFLSCSKKEEVVPVTSFLNTNLITGLDLRQDEFSEVIRLGNPNNIELQSIVFPNPSIDYLNIQINNASNISLVWILNGFQEKIYQDLNFDTVLNSNLYTEQELNQKSVLLFSDNSSSNLQLNLESLTDGYYRIFIKVDDNIEWHNIYKGPVEIQDLMDYWNN